MLPGNLETWRYVHLPSDKEMMNHLIDTYSNLQRIKEADDSLRELDYQ